MRIYSDKIASGSTSLLLHYSAVLGARIQDQNKAELFRSKFRETVIDYYLKEWVRWQIKWKNSHTLQEQNKMRNNIEKEIDKNTLYIFKSHSHKLLKKLDEAYRKNVKQDGAIKFKNFKVTEGWRDAGFRDPAGKTIGDPRAMMYADFEKQVFSQAFPQGK